MLAPTTSPSLSPPPLPVPRASLRLLTFNVDMDSPSLVLRTHALANAIVSADPHIAFLQELSAVPERLMTGSGSDSSSLTLLTRFLGARFEIILGEDNPPEEPYFTAILRNKKYAFKVLEARRIPFEPGMTLQGRDVLMADVEMELEGGGTTVLRGLTAHLESLAEGSERRKGQLQTVREIMVGSQVSIEASGSGGKEKTEAAIELAVFGGDTNLRQAEVKAAWVRSAADVGKGKATPGKLGDVFVQLGSAKDVEATWDPMKNDNKENGWAIQKGFKGMRFDRFFYYPAGKSGGRRREWRPVGMRLVGTERMESTGHFISDHWGLLTVFSCETDQPG